ncbi:TonB-dependent receptor [Zunongwangia sp. HGR-M22]|uniref:TonB-dependent receptor n=1 Tax=Zunongwangia sp. HGR-M22 TaxID=3015168 RepID=UPI0022DDEA57|nr:TonB-dependent receptor [Zunongwangia sp. HGR-M22]WBL24177.1 TonB-dependent receptor [Zunongwangia sp. HGR-M22]
MRMLLITLLFTAMAPIIYAQNQFSGNITNHETGEPVFSATVYFARLEKGTTTDIDGNFTIKNLPSGNYKLVVSSIGFTSYSNEVSIPSSNFKIVLNPSAVEMEEVIVSTPFHQLQSENVMRVERESVSELNKKGAVTLADGISQIAGVENLSTGVGIGKPVIRGLSSNRVLTYTQGVRMENQQFGGEHGLGISSKGIGSVEVIKGPASLLYGSDALGGVLYLNPEQYASAGETNAEVNGDYFSNTLGYQASAMAKTSGDKLKFIARGSLAEHSDYKAGNGERVTNTRFNEKDLKTGIAYQNAKLKSDLRYNFNRSELGIPEEIAEQTTSKTLVLPYQQIDNHILSLDNKIYFANSSIDAKFGYQFNNRKEFEDHHEHGEEEHEDHADEEHDHEGEHEDHDHEEESEELHPALDMELETFNYNIKYNLPKIGNFETIAGIQGMWQENKNTGEEVLIPNAETVDFGIFTTTHFHLKKWDFQAGLRYDTRNIDSDVYGDTDDAEYIQAVDRDFNSFNGAFGAKYQFNKHLNARLNLASGFRAPNLAELTSNGSHHGANRYEVGNANLDNEQNFQIDFSLEWRNEHFEAFANAFHNTINNYIYLNPTGETINENPVYDYVQDDAELYGGEAGIHIHPHPWDWLHIESSFETVTGKRSDDAYLPLIPANSITNTFRVEFNEGKIIENKYAFIRLKNVFDKENTSAFETRTGGYSLLGAGIGGRVQLEKSEVQISVNGNNLLDKTYISHLSRLKTDGISNIGRNIMVSVQWFL